MLGCKKNGKIHSSPSRHSETSKLGFDKGWADCTDGGRKCGAGLDWRLVHQSGRCALRRDVTEAWVRVVGTGMKVSEQEVMVD